jgi:hypothetical protein
MPRSHTMITLGGVGAEVVPTRATHAYRIRVEGRRQPPLPAVQNVRYFAAGSMW